MKNLTEQKNKLKIGILVQELEYPEEIIAESLRENGFDVKIYDLRKTSIGELAENNIVLNRVFASVANRDFKDNLLALELLEGLENQGVLCLNSHFTSKCDYSKYFSAQMMLKAGIRSPKTYLIKTESDIEDAKEFAEDHGLLDGVPIVLKRDIGGRGKDIHLIKSVDNFENKIKGILDKSREEGYFGGYVLQEFVKSVLPHDYRISIINGEVTYSMARSFIKDEESGDEWISSMTLGSKEQRVELPEEIKNLSLAATDVIGGFFNDTDIIVSDIGPYVIENNPTPNFANRQRGNESDKKRVVIDKLVQEIRKVANEK